MIKKERIKKTFSERIVNFDFQRFYTPKIRLLCHVFMWIAFTCLAVAGNFYAYHFSLSTSFFLSIRMTLCNIICFYLFFYFVVPQTLNKDRILLFILAIPICVQFWLIINHYYFIILYDDDSGIRDTFLAGLLKNNYGRSIFEILSPQNMLAHGMEVILSLSPFMFIKITFDLSKLYSKLIITDRKNEKLEYQNIIIEKKFLQAQLNPHFLFNTLNNLYGLTLIKDDKAPEIILKLSEIMRYTLYDINAETITVEKEIEFIENYVEMEKMRYPKDYDINLVVENCCTGLKISPLLFFTFIENAFKYGLKSENPQLNILIKVKENNVYFLVENDTLLKQHIKENQQGGIGIKNNKKGLDLLFSGKYNLDIQNNKQNFIVKLILEL